MMIDLLAVDESAMLRCRCRTLTYVAGRKTGDGQTGEIPLVSRFPLFDGPGSNKRRPQADFEPFWIRTTARVCIGLMP
jgi:hypothetical protein